MAQAHFLQNKKIMGVTTNLDFAVDAMKKMGIPAHFFDKLETKESVRNFAERTGTVCFPLPSAPLPTLCSVVDHLSILLFAEIGFVHTFEEFVE